MSEFDIGLSTDFENIRIKPNLRRADVMFAVDCTNTMSDTLQAVLEAIHDVVAIYSDSQVQIRIGLTEFRDQAYDYDQKVAGYNLMHIHKFDGEDFTQNTDAFCERLEKLEAYGGGPENESTLDAIAFALQDAKWDEDADSIIVMFSDAPPNRNDVRVKGGICGLCPIVKEHKLNQLYLVIDKENRKIRQDYEDIFACVPDPTNPEITIMGDTFAIKRDPDSYQTRDPKNLEHLKDILKTIAHTSSGVLKASRLPNIYAQHDEEQATRKRLQMFDECPKQMRNNESKPKKSAKHKSKNKSTRKQNRTGKNSNPYS
jgi:hypothetical protein